MPNNNKMTMKLSLYVITSKLLIPLNGNESKATFYHKKIYHNIFEIGTLDHHSRMKNTSKAKVSYNYINILTFQKAHSTVDCSTQYIT